MATRTILPKTVSLPPMAELVDTFEESDPDACRLLLPFKDSLTPGELEFRARREFPQRAPALRTQIVARAVELLDLLPDAEAGKVKGAVSQRTGVHVPTEEKERRIRILVAALVRDPMLTAVQGLTLLNDEHGASIARGTFYGGYWRRAVDLLPPEVRRVRNEMTAPRPGGRRMDLSDSQRARVRVLVAELKRDRPELHVGEVMDEVRRITGLAFQDARAFRRHYFDRAEPAPGIAPERGSADSKTNASFDGQAAAPAVPAVTVAGDERDGSVPELRRPEGDGSILDTLLRAADPVTPVELSATEGEQLQLKVNLLPLAKAESYALISRVYCEMARLAATESSQPDP